MDAGGIDQRKPGAAGRIVRSRALGRQRELIRPSEPARDSAPVAQVIHRALVAGELPAVAVGNATDQLALGEVPVDPERRQVVGIRTTYPLRSRGVELPLTQVRVRRPEGGLVVLVLLLVKNAGRNGNAR